MKLVSMKMTKAEREEKYSGKAIDADAPSYPYGLTVRLDNDALDRLKLKKLPEVGKSYMLIARCDVTSVSSNESEHGKNENLELQITDLALDLDKGDNADAADKLYDGNAKAV